MTKKRKREEKAPPIGVRLSVEERELLALFAQADGKKDAALAVEILSAGLAKRARRLKRLQRRAGRNVVALDRQIALFEETREA